MPYDVQSLLTNLRNPLPQDQGQDMGQDQQQPMPDQEQQPQGDPMAFVEQLLASRQGADQQPAQQPDMGQTPAQASNTPTVGDMGQSTQQPKAGHPKREFLKNLLGNFMFNLGEGLTAASNAPRGGEGGAAMGAALQGPTKLEQMRRQQAMEEQKMALERSQMGLQTAQSMMDMANAQRAGQQYENVDIDLPGGTKASVPRNQIGTVMSAAIRAKATADQERRIDPLSHEGMKATLTLKMLEQQFGLNKPQGSFEERGFTEDFLPAFAEKAGKSVKDLTPAERTEARKQYKTITQDPEMQDLKKQLAQMSLQNQRMMQLGDEDIEKMAQSLANYETAPSQVPVGMRGGAVKIKIMNRAKEINPNYSSEGADSLFSFGKSPATVNRIRLMDSVQNSLDLAQKASDSLNKSNFKVFNKAKIAALEQAGDPRAARITAITTIMADEMGQIFTGGTSSATSDAKIKLAREILDKDYSPAQFNAAIESIKSLLAARKTSLIKGTFFEKENSTGAMETQTLNGVTYQRKAGSGEPWRKKQ